MRSAEAKGQGTMNQRNSRRARESAGSTRATRGRGERNKEINREKEEKVGMDDGESRGPKQQAK